MIKKVVSVVEDSQAEEYFMNQCVPKIKGDISVRLGSMWDLETQDGRLVNQYSFSAVDAFRIRRELAVLKNGHKVAVK